MNILVYDVDFNSSGVDYPIKNALLELGHSVDMFDWRKFLYSYNSNTFVSKVKDKFGFEFVCVKINKALKKQVIENYYDLVLVIRGEHIFPETISFIKLKSTIIANWSSDDLFNNLNGSRYLIKTIPLYDIHFSPRRHLKDEYIKCGAKKFEVIDWYYRPELLIEKKIIDTPIFNSEISFVGSWSARRQIILGSLYDHQFDLYGWGWQKKINSSNFPNWKINKPISMIEMMQVFLKSKININIFTIENRDLINPRNFDLSVAGAFQLSERSNELLEVFEEDKDIVCFSSNEELKSKTDFYLKNDTLRDKIRFSAYKKISNGNFTLYDRVKKIIDVVNN